MISTNQSGQTLPGLTLKAWAQVTAAGTLVKGFNVTSITKGAAGLYTTNFTTNMATATFLNKVQCTTSSAQPNYVTNSRAVGTCNYTTKDSTLANVDMDHYIEFWE